MFFIIFPLILIFSIYGCNNSSTINRIPVSSLSKECIEEIDSEGAFLINSTNQQIIVFAEEKQAIKEIRFIENGDNVNVYYYTETIDNNKKHMTLYQEALKIENKDHHIDTINIFLNDKPSSFAKSIVL